MPSLVTRHPPSATSSETSLLESFRIQLQVVHALFMREVLTRFGRHNIGFMWMFAEPMIFTLGVTILWNIIGLEKGSGITITAFILTGYSTILLWRNVPGRCVMALQPNYSLMFHRVVKPADIFFARIMLEIVGATISFVFLCIIYHSLGLVELPHDHIKMWSAWLLLAWYAGALALLIGALSEHSEIVDKLWHPAMYLLVPLSGCFWMVESLPPDFRRAVLFIPTVHCTEMFREGYFGSGHVWHYDVLYIVSFNMALSLLGLSMVRGLRVSPSS